MNPIIETFSKLLPLSNLVDATRQKVWLPFYHTVYKENPLSYIENLYPMRSLEEFRRDLDMLLEHFEPVDLQFLIDLQKKPRDLDKKVFHLTFDDGLSGCYDLILPELEKRGIPATFFLNTSFIDNENLFYRYKVGLILEEIRKDELKRKSAEKTLHFSKDIDKTLLALGYDEIDLIDSVAEAIDLDFQSFLEREKPYLVPSQIKKMIQKGFTIGAHSQDHPLYSKIRGDNQWMQTIYSLDYLQEDFDLKNRAFAFPFSDDGVEAKFFDALREDAEIDISFGTSGLKNDEVDFHWQRIPMEIGEKSGEDILKYEAAYYLLKSITGNNTKTR